ncbi:kinase [Micromonospora taraxaci]|uniref:kinase n=1 Tax=Micromonospora taraxaci TaxID=1316803 RepID=UPI0033E626BE
MTGHLISVSSEFEHFRRLKSGHGRTVGYRMTSEDHLRQLREQPGEVLWENQRYGSTYVVDRAGLDEIWRSGRVPVVHLGQDQAVTAVIERTKGQSAWTVVELHCDPALIRSRIVARATGDTDARVTAAAETPRLATADLRIDTGTVSPEVAAEMIARCM